MTRLLFMLFLLPLAASCGLQDDVQYDGAKDFCQDWIRSLCQRVDECGTAKYNTVRECVEVLSVKQGCSNVTTVNDGCSRGESFDDSYASSCVDRVNQSSCDNVVASYTGCDLKRVCQ